MTCFVGGVKDFIFYEKKCISFVIFISCCTLIGYRSLKTIINDRITRARVYGGYQRV